MTRTFRYFRCGKCDARIPDYLTFGVGFGQRARHYCLHHIPRRTRVRMWLRGWLKGNA